MPIVDIGTKHPSQATAGMLAQVGKAYTKDFPHPVWKVLAYTILISSWLVVSSPASSSQLPSEL